MDTKDARIAAHLQDMAAAIDKAFEKLVGSRVNFSILVWAEEGETNRFQYVPKPRTSCAKVRRARITATGPAAPGRYRRRCGAAASTGIGCRRRCAIASGVPTGPARKRTSGRALNIWPSPATSRPGSRIN